MVAIHSSRDLSTTSTYSILNVDTVSMIILSTVCAQECYFQASPETSMVTKRLKYSYHTESRRVGGIRISYSSLSEKMIQLQYVQCRRKVLKELSEDPQPTTTSSTYR